MIGALLLSCCLLAPSALSLNADGDEPVAATGTGSDTLSRADFGLWLIDRAGLDNVQDYLVSVLAQRAAAERDLLPSDAEVMKGYLTERDIIVDEYYHGELAAYELDIVRREQDPVKHGERRRKQLRTDMTLAALARADREVPDERVARRYRDLYGPLGELTRIDVLFFSMYQGLEPGGRPDLTALKAEALNRAQGAERALRGGESFADVHSTSDPVKSEFVSDRGRIDVYRRNLLGEELDSALASLDEPGDISPTITVFDGYYVVRLVDRTAVSEEDAREGLIDLIRDAPANSSEIANARQRLLDQDGVAVLLD